ncbi:MAG: glycosyl hydrolase, partial [Lachnospiraceae bacterium]|nr:glycosyl hydrolase [Lachnospiraceae bacterium]
MKIIDLLKIYNKKSFDYKLSKETAQISIEPNEEGFLITIDTKFLKIYGLGEKFDSISQEGKLCVNEVKEQFCNQGEYTYLSIPFFMTDAGLGVLADTKIVSKFDFREGIKLNVPKETKLVLFTGKPVSIIKELNEYLGGEIPTPPKFSFMPWVSANHWKSEEDVIKLQEELKKYDFPAGVIVLEAWSDEATFYIFNGAKYKEKTDGSSFKYEDFDFSESKYWHNPKEMIKSLNEDGLHLVLWQIPVYKKMEEGNDHLQNELDAKYAIDNKLCVFEDDNNPYRIPEGNWFAGSLIPDFTNKETVKNWFEKRQYLLDIGVEGFKTDGGEFIYKDNLVFSNKETGREQKNAYSQTYVNAYKEFAGDNRILFSRAGYIGASQIPFLWAGDHQSTNEELKHAFYSAMSTANSGIRYWGFDIGGFAGPLPSKDLYLRSTQFACFCPVMQWHSEPDGGQFKELMPGAEGNNERSPWNIAAHYKDESFIDEIRFWHKLRMKLLPYIYKEAKKSAETGVPMMRPLWWLDNENKELLKWEDEYCFGEEMLVAPLLEENQKERDLYLPEGEWTGFFSQKEYKGNQKINSKDEKYPVYV